MAATEEEQWNLIAGEGTSECAGSSLITATIQGRFLDVLTSPTARPLLLPFARALVSTDHRSDLQPFRAVSLRGSYDNGQNASPDALAVAVASLHAFIQLNWTGPDLPEDFDRPAILLRKVVPDVFPPRSLDDAASDNEEARYDQMLRNASLEELTWNGEPAYHLCRSPFFLLFAIRILSSLPAHLLTLSWWRLRAASIHARILDIPTSPEEALFTSLQSVKTHLTGTLHRSKTCQDKSRWGMLLARLYVDEGLVRQRCGGDREANELFVKAAAASGLKYEVTGALGRRTKFQKEEKTILVLLAESSLKDGGTEVAKTADSSEDVEGKDKAEEEEYDDDPVSLPSSGSAWKASPAANQTQGMPSEMNLNDDTLLERTRFSSSASAGSLSHLSASDPRPLHPLDSSILLSLSLNINNTSPENGLTSSEISAFVARVLTHARNWSVHTMALLLRSRLEASRTRTAQRSVLQLQALLDQMPSSDSSLDERLLYFHELELPSTWEMQAELARRYAALGVIRSALEIFEQVEMWEEAVQCWGALGRQDRGIEVVRDLLEGRKVESSQAIQERKAKSNSSSSSNEQASKTINTARQAKLWCLLGDLEADKAEEHYLKAWQISSQRSARAARSLGGINFARLDYQQTILWLRRALKVNPLYTRSWFILGCAYMKLDSAQGFLEAARCFRRCTSLDDEDGESWNNLASCYLRLSQQGRGALYDAQLSNDSSTAHDATEVLSGVDDARSDSETDSDSLHSRDSGVALDSSDDAESDDTEGGTESIRYIAPESGSSTAFDVKLLAHRALTKALRFSHDDWRIWNNYMIVSVDCGLMGEAVRGMNRVIQIRATKAASAGSDSQSKGEDFIDIAVLNRLVDAVTRAPSREEDATESTTGDSQGLANHNAHEGHGLYPALHTLFENTLLPIVMASPSVYRAYARLLIWRGRFRSALEAHLNAWRISYGSDAHVEVTTDKVAFLEAIEELGELCEILENYAERSVHVDSDGNECEGQEGVVVREEATMDNWRFRARSLIRSFMGRTKDSFEDEPEWDSLIELRSSFASK